MAKNKISEWSATPANNTDIGGIDIAEGCAPSGINNAIRELMAQVKDMQTGADGDSLTISGTLVASGTLDVTGGFLLDGSAGTSGQFLASAGTGNSPTWVSSIPSGVIVMWSGSIASIPSGWYLCNGSNGTPDLRNKFVIGAFQDNSGVANTTITGSNTLTGGSKDSVVVSHSHTATQASHSHNVLSTRDNSQVYAPQGGTVGGVSNYIPSGSSSDHSLITDTKTPTITVASTGDSGTNANLPPYYALAFIMKA